MTWNNLTFIENATTLTQALEGVNNMADGWLIGGLMITMFVVTFMVFYGRVGIGEILIGNGFLFTIMALIFINMNLLPEWVLGITVSLLIFGILAVFMSD